MPWWNGDLPELSEGLSPAVFDRFGVAETPLGRLDVMSLMSSLGSLSPPAAAIRSEPRGPWADSAREWPARHWRRRAER